jgi:xanthine dehydrogenase accessory factor
MIIFHLNGYPMNKLIFQNIAKFIAENHKSWLTTVVNVSGSTPGKVGAKMVVNVDGEIIGTIGGGNVEMCVINKVIKERPTQIVRWAFDLGGNIGEEKTGMLCGGHQEILVEPLFGHHELYIVGGGHCGQALAELASKCDFSVTIIDDRAEYATAEVNPDATRLIHAPYKDVAQHINFSSDIYIVVMTHGHRHDELVMRQVLGKSYKYLGVIGSKSKVRTVFEHLLRDGFAEDELKRIYSPIGFSIGSQTPMEIAVSITAQLIAVRSGVL